MDLISVAFAEDAPASTATVATTEKPTELLTPPSTGETIMSNVVMVIAMLALFYLLLIRPQQKRYKEHSTMINKLDKGSKVVTQGGLVGIIDKVVSEHEVIVDFGNNIKMTLMRSYILGLYKDATNDVANDDKKKKGLSSK